MSDLSVYNRTMLNVNTDPSLSLAAVGLWHKMNAAYGRNFDRVDILTLHPDPNAWGPNDEEHDLDGPLDELIALGYAETRGKTVSLSSSGAMRRVPPAAGMSALARIAPSAACSGPKETNDEEQRWHAIERTSTRIFGMTTTSDR